MPSRPTASSIRSSPIAIPLGWALALVPLLIALNAFFVAAEYAVVAITPAQLQSLRGSRRSRKSVDALAQLVTRPAQAIGTIQICITMTNLMLGWIGEPAMSAVLEAAFGSLVRIWPTASRIIATILSFVIVTLLTVVLSELLPKAVTLRYVISAGMLTAVPVLAIERVMRPLVWVMTKLGNAVTLPLGLGRVDDLEKQDITVDELRLLAARAAEAGTLSARERSLVLNSLAIGRRAAREIMIPRVRVQFLDLQWPMEKNREVMNAFLHSRLPLCNGGMDKVIGLVRTKEFLAAYHAAAESNVLSLIALPAVFAPSLISLDRLLALMHERRTEFVFLVDEHGGVDGIVTLQDVVDELVGEIQSDASPSDANPDPETSCEKPPAGE